MLTRTSRAKAPARERVSDGEPAGQQRRCPRGRGRPGPAPSLAEPVPLLAIQLPSVFAPRSAVPGWGCPGNRGGAASHCWWRVRPLLPAGTGQMGSRDAGASLALFDWRPRVSRQVGRLNGAQGNRLQRAVMIARRQLGDGLWR